MSYMNRRNQHAVGQGFFHSGDLCEDNSLMINYVYDCGSMEKYSKERCREIKSYQRRLGPGAVLDILFLSHMHADHVNGLEQLLDVTHGVAVDTIVLPLVNVVDRLIALARTALADPASTRNAFYRDFITDPGAALRRFRPNQIIFVRPGDRRDGAPDGEDRPFAPLDGPPIAGKRRSEQSASWSLVGSGTVEAADRGAHDVAPGILIPDTLALMARGIQGEWLFAPFVDPTLAVHRNRFLNSLAWRRKLSRTKLDAWLAAPANVRSIIVDGMDDLAAAYANVSGNLNTTSLCLYSGPARKPSPNLFRSHAGRFGRVCVGRESWDQPIAWLATGDAALAQKQRRADFLVHYGRLLHEVTTLTLPHHGSDNNFHPDLLTKAQPTFCIAAADEYSTWKHPGPHTVQAVCSYPAVLQVVTSKKPSSVSEQALIG